MTNLLGIILVLFIIVWGLSVVWSVVEMVNSPLNNDEYSPFIISFVSVLPLVNTMIALILMIYNKTRK